MNMTKKKPFFDKAALGAGWGAKIGPGDLNEALQGLDTIFDPNVIVGAEKLDDAGVYKISEELALVQTLDYFTPIVRDPYVFGQIAAANALSDVYAMGGRPITAMNIIAFPASSMDLAILSDILRGGMDKLKEAGVPLLGGHSLIDQTEVKYGLAVTGVVHPKKNIDKWKGCSRG